MSFEAGSSWELLSGAYFTYGSAPSDVSWANDLSEPELFTYPQMATEVATFDCSVIRDIVFDSELQLVDSGTDIDGGSLWVPAVGDCGYHGMVFGAYATEHGSFAFDEDTVCGLIVDDLGRTTPQLYVEARWHDGVSERESTTFRIALPD